MVVLRMLQDDNLIKSIAALSNQLVANINATDRLRKIIFPLFPVTL